MFPTPAVDIGPLRHGCSSATTSAAGARACAGCPSFSARCPSAVMAEEMETPGDGQIRALVSIAGNPVLSTPNGARLERALAGLELHGVDRLLRERDDAPRARRLAARGTSSRAATTTSLLSRFAVRNIVKYSPPILARDDDTRDDWEIAGELVARIWRRSRPATGRGSASASRGGCRSALLDLLLRFGPYRTLARELARVAARRRSRAARAVVGGARRDARRSRRRSSPPTSARVERWLDERRGGASC